jgi:hypothetical protein
MKTIRSFILSLFLLLNFTMVGQVSNPPHWVFGISAGSEFLYPNSETNPIGVTYGVFQQFSIKDFSVAAGITFGQREIYEKASASGGLGNSSFTSTRSRDYRESSLTTDLFIKYYPSFIPSKHLIFVGLGIQFKKPTKVKGYTTSMNSRISMLNDTFPTRGVDGKMGYRIAIGMDHYMSEKVFFTGKLGCNFFLNQVDSIDLYSKDLTYTGGSNNIFIEIQLGYNFKKI